MEANIIKVGNSKGIIIPSKFLKLIGLNEKVNIDVEDNRLIIESVNRNPRSNWESLFSKANSKREAALLLPDVFEDESFEEWQW